MEKFSVEILQFFSTAKGKKTFIKAIRFSDSCIFHFV